MEGDARGGRRKGGEEAALLIKMVIAPLLFTSLQNQLISKGKSLVGRTIKATNV